MYFVEALFAQVHFAGTDDDNNRLTSFEYRIENRYKNIAKIKRVLL